MSQFQCSHFLHTYRQPAASLSHFFQAHLKTLVADQQVPVGSLRSHPTAYKLQHFNRYLQLSLTLLDFCLQLKNAHFELSELKQCGFDATSMILAGYDVPSLKSAGYEASSLFEVGIRLFALKLEGRDVPTFQSLGHDASSLLAAGMGLISLKQAGYDVPSLKLAGVDLASFKAAGFDALSLMNGGYDYASLNSVGYKASSFLAAGAHLVSPKLAECLSLGLITSANNCDDPELGHAGVLHLLKCLPTSVISLNLRSTGLKDISQDFCNCLCTFSSLISLDISDNEKLTNDHLKLVLQALPTSLKVLNLKKMGLHMERVFFLQTSLARLNQIEDLNLSHNFASLGKMDSATKLDSIFEICHRCFPRLRTLNLSGVPNLHNVPQEVSRHFRTLILSDCCVEYRSGRVDMICS